MIRFTIPGPPVPKGRPRTITRDGRSHTYTPRKTAKYEEKVKSYALVARQLAGVKAPYKGEVGLSLRVPTSARGDLDNLTKALEDACNGILWVDDRQVAELHVIREDRPDMEVQVWPL